MVQHDPAKIIERIKGLLANGHDTKSYTPEVAAQYLAEAARLMAKHQIEVCEDFDEKTQKWEFTITEGTDALYHGSRISDWQHRLLLQVGNFFGGKIVKWHEKKWDLNAAKDAWEKEDMSRFIYVGTKEDATFAKMVFWDISKRTKAIFDRQKRALRLTSLDSFGYGVVSTIMNRMFTERDKMIQSQISERGLMTYNQKDQDFQSFYDRWAMENGVTTSPSKRQPPKFNWNDVQKGRAVGSDMALPVFNPTVQ